MGGCFNENNYDYGIEYNSNLSLNSSNKSIKETIEDFTREEKTKFLSQFKILLNESHFEYGFSSLAEDYVRKSLDDFDVFAMDWINEYFIQNFEDEFIVSSILKVLMHLDYSSLGPQAITILLASLNHKSLLVKEDVLRTFENWENPEHIQILESILWSEDWLLDMKEEVIENLKSL